MLKQTELQYKYLAIQEEFQGVLNFMQLTGMTLNLYYKMMANRLKSPRELGVYSTPRPYYRWRQMIFMQVRCMLTSLMPSGL